MAASEKPEATRPSAHTADTNAHRIHGPASPDLWALAIEGSGTGVWDRNVVTGDIWYSPSWHAILGYADQELSNRIEQSYTRVHPDDLAYVQATMQAHFEGRTDSYEVEHRLRCKDGSYKWVLSRGRVVSRDQSGRALRMVGTTTDITATRTLSETLQRSVSLITDLTNQIPGLVFQYYRDADGQAGFSYVSIGLHSIFELAAEQVADTDAPVLQRIHPEDRAPYRQSLVISADNLTPWHLEFRVLLPQQGIRWRQVAAQPRQLPEGRTVWHGLITDITERKQMEVDLQQLARIDDLTQLPNRRDLRTRMDALLQQLKRDGDSRAAVMLMDIDRFKEINDTAGHSIGDSVMRYFADILRQNLRKDEIIGRLGGDEFVVVIPSAGLPEAHALANRIRRAIEVSPPSIAGYLFQFTVSFGITIMDQLTKDSDEALVRADLALYRAKQQGRNRVDLDSGRVA